MSTARPWACRLRGCRWHFAVDGVHVRWQCERCGARGARACADAATARRLAEACSRGAPHPPLGLLAGLAGTVHRERRD